MTSEAENEARKALQCLLLEVPSEVAADVKQKVLAWVEDLEEQIEDLEMQVEDEIQRRTRYHDAITQARILLTLAEAVPPPSRQQEDADEACSRP